MGRKNKPRMIPEQDNRICGSICLCQLTVVLSCVSIVYLSVAIYLPSYRAFNSGFEPEPVMCQTIDMTMTNNCPWASCGEWCLTKVSGQCEQIHTTVRRNATEMVLKNCNRIQNTACPWVEPHTAPKLNCNNGSLCETLRGVFNCSNGHCYNWSVPFQCLVKGDGFSLDPEKDNTKLTGFFQCFGPKCTKITKQFKCDRYCAKITTTSINVLIRHVDSLITAECEMAEALTEARGNEPEVRIEPTQFWEEHDGIMLTSCTDVLFEDNRIIGYDCLNGTLLNQTDIPYPFMNFTQLWRLYERSNNTLDLSQRFLPKQQNITIYNSSRMLINLEACVNTLKGECQEFMVNYGNDGDNDTAPSRYPCFYNKHDSNFVVARFDLVKTYRDLMIAAILPTILFVISFISLCVITNSVKVGDDTKMRCTICTGDNSSDIDELTGMKRKSEICSDHDLNLDEQADTQLPIEEQINIMEANDLAGSTKSLIPLSPCNETIGKTISSDNRLNNQSTPDIRIEVALSSRPSVST